MKLFKRQQHNLTEKEHVPVTPVIKIDSLYRGLDYLVELIKQIRPQHHRDVAEAELKFKALLYQLQSDKLLLFSLRKALLSQFISSNIVPALTESGMVSSRGFIQELITKLKHKLLPPYQNADDFLYVVNHVFYNKSDHVWVKAIDRKLWVYFFDLLGIQVNITQPNILGQLNQSLHILAQRTVNLGIEKEVIGNVPNLDYKTYPFVLLDRAVQQYLQAYEADKPFEEMLPIVKQVVFALYQCRSILQLVDEARKQHGTSLSQTYILFRIQQQLERMFIITDVLDKDQRFDTDRFIHYFIQIIYNEKKKNSLREFINANFSFLAYKITEHGGQRGENYITATGKEYWQMIRSAMLGGFIISFAAIIKNLLGKLALAPFWKGFAYSTNYAVSFQLMQETNATLATKQPAYTAAAIAASLDNKSNFGKPDLYGLSILVARTIRSQLASFFGNLIIVFPLSFALAAAFHLLTGNYLVDGPAAHKMLMDQHPLRSFSIIYACFTGFFLFASGLIAGYVENGINYGRVGVRLHNHPLFKNTLSRKRLDKLTRYVESNMGALVGNIALGFFLGMAGFFGTIFGVPFDIRHITIAAGNSAIAYYTQGSQESLALLLTVFGGVLLIGFFNFLVSFSLAFTVALKSRGVRLRDFPELITILSKFFYHYPKDFIFPPGQPRQADAVRQTLAGRSL